MPRGKRTGGNAPRLTAARIKILLLKRAGYLETIPALRFSRDDALALLREFVLLSKDVPPTGPLGMLLLYLRTAVQDRLDGKATTIDQGLGLIQAKRGGRKASTAVLQKRLRLAREVAKQMDVEKMSKEDAVAKVSESLSSNPEEQHRYVRDAYDELKFLARIFNRRDTRNRS